MEASDGDIDGFKVGETLGITIRLQLEAVDGTEDGVIVGL